MHHIGSLVSDGTRRPFTSTREMVDCDDELGKLLLHLTVLSLSTPLNDSGGAGFLGASKQVRRDQTSTLAITMQTAVLSMMLISAMRRRTATVTFPLRAS